MRRGSSGPRVWLITGASRGIGRALTEAVLAHGASVVAGCRQPDTLARLAEAHPNRLLPVALDVTVIPECSAAVDAAVVRFGRVDLLANVVGVGLVSAAEETGLDRALALFDVNFWGSVRMIQAALPVMREQHAGHVIQISSLSGRVGAAGVAFYAASKFAVEGFSESLMAELAPLGIRVTIVEPGGVRTDWAGPSLWSIPSSPAYEPSVGATRAILARAHGNQPTAAEDVAAAIVALSRDPKPPRRLAVGPDARRRIADALRTDLAELEQHQH